MRRDIFANRLKIAMIKSGYRQVDVIKKANELYADYNIRITKADMSQYLSGIIKYPRSDKLMLLSQILDVQEPWLLGYDVDEHVG